MPVTGKVKWFSNVKGYGFIEQDGGGQDVFVHYSSLTNEGYKKLEQGDTVTFELLQGEKGPQASQVVRQKKKKEAEQDQPGAQKPSKPK